MRCDRSTHLYIPTYIVHLLCGSAELPLQYLSLKRQRVSVSRSYHTISPSGCCPQHSGMRSPWLPNSCYRCVFLSNLLSQFASGSSNRAVWNLIKELHRKEQPGQMARTVSVT